MCYHLRLGDVAVTIAIAVAAGTRPQSPLPPLARTICESVRQLNVSLR